ncbi:hypothetical protein OGAPHI_003834 [Ogataea philodendri]|uniref:Uncharacterized protein n=1 Tax=Ogataea philodendri TaxID=1378263 RepID=A0A9P8T587_9ASCO|nr:uncharacterized protein OGAPHI_003834 [Ogataea philodendri]KAH3665646.1 hypothetical protein OGAPHI_003834 [Ogataea philodendri]
MPMLDKAFCLIEAELKQPVTLSLFGWPSGPMMVTVFLNWSSSLGVSRFELFLSLLVIARSTLSRVADELEITSAKSVTLILDLSLSVLSKWTRICSRIRSPTLVMPISFRAFLSSWGSNSVLILFETNRSKYSSHSTVSKYCSSSNRSVSVKASDFCVGASSLLV